MKIVVTGSLGNISKPLSEELIKKGHSVTVISSNKDRKQEIEDLGAKAAIGSLEDTPFLQNSFEGSNAVYCMIPPSFKESNGLEYYKRIGQNYKHAIEQSRVDRVVFLSSWGAHLDKGTGTILGCHHVERILEQIADVHLTYIRPCSIYYNLYNFIDLIKNSGIIGTNYKGTDKLVWVSPTDIADAVAEEFDKEILGNLDVRYVASDEVTANETARILGSAIGKPELTWTEFTDEAVKLSFLKMGLTDRFAQDLVDLNASISSGRMGEDYETHKPVLGKVKLTDFAKDFAAAYYK
ncbi:MAG: NmrA family NAD(P)-binding protein [Pedobacter sp.]|uniref:NmrA family NAD(P)-binding protein n=1 Tax=Pedobacter sp. TaxID=1411316 RepID=UPI00339B78B6